MGAVKAWLWEVMEGKQEVAGVIHRLCREILTARGLQGRSEGIARAGHVWLAGVVLNGESQRSSEGMGENGRPAGA